MAEDDVTLQIKLEWTQRRLEESDELVKSLRANVEALLQSLADAQHKVDVLGIREETLVANVREERDRVEELIKEKSELAAENASLRSVARDAAQRAMMLSSAETLIDQSHAVAHKAGAASAVTVDGAGNLAEKLSASRLLVSRLLWVIQRSGLRVTDSDLLGTVPEASDASPTANGSGAGQAIRREVAESLVAALRLQQEYTQAGGQEVAAALSATSGAGAVAEARSSPRPPLPSHGAGVTLPPPPPGTRFDPLPPPPGMDKPPGSRYGSRKNSDRALGAGQASGAAQGSGAAAGQGVPGSGSGSGILSSFFSLLVGEVGTPVPSEAVGFRKEADGAPAPGDADTAPSPAQHHDEAAAPSPTAATGLQEGAQTAE